MRKALPILFSVLVLSLVSIPGALAGALPDPASVSPAVAAPQTPALAADIFSPLDSAVFVDEADVDTVAYNACCQGNFSICAASCTADVRSFTCTRVGARGCSTSCTCN
jgi:hypothetical protein